MKALSLLQPWASLVVLGHKKIETRSWNTKYRGELLIHASAGKKENQRTTYLDFQQQFFNLELPRFKDLPFGAIIGKVNLIDTFKIEEAETIINHNEDLFGISDITDNDAWIKAVEQEKAFGDYSEGRYGWLFSEPVIFNPPVPAKGSLSIWNYESSCAMLQDFKTL